jgi:L,D-transpeptidase ErfK/SrfK
MSRSLITALALGALALPAVASPAPPTFGPGRIVGTLHDIGQPRGLSIDLLASRYGVHPVRIVRPSWGVLKDGLQRGERLTVDQRRIEPRFPATMSGLVLNIPEAHLYQVENGRLLKDYPVGVSRSDWQAPIGRTQIVSMEKNPVWVVPDSIKAEMEKAGRPVIERIEAGPGNPLGNRWIGFGNGRYGIHGTTVPTSIKRYASHGCVRMLAPHLLDLYGRVKVGMPVYVTYQTVLLAADPKGIWLSAYPDVYERQPDRIGQVRSLATEAGVASRVDWKTVSAVLKRADGMVVNIATPGGPIQVKPVPTAKPTASPSVRPTETPSVSPTAAPTVAPTATPHNVPSALPSALPTAATTVTPGPMPNGQPSPVSTETAPASPAAPSVPTLSPTPADDERPL